MIYFYSSLFLWNSPRPRQFRKYFKRVKEKEKGYYRIAYLSFPKQGTKPKYWKAERSLPMITVGTLLGREWWGETEEESGPLRTSKAVAVPAEPALSLQVCSLPWEQGLVCIQGIEYKVERLLSCSLHQTRCLRNHRPPQVIETLHCHQRLPNFLIIYQAPLQSMADFDNIPWFSPLKLSSE